MGTARSGGDGTRAAERTNRIVAHSLPKILLSSPRVTGWKYPTAISTITLNSESAAAAERVGAVDASESGGAELVHGSGGMVPLRAE